jgi:phage terminase large subunit-like protein
MAALLVLWWSFTTPKTEIIVAANDLEQAQSRVFKTAVDLCLANAALRASVNLRQSGRITITNGTIITAIAADYRGAAGSRHSLYCIDEPWRFTQESATRLVEELTPTEPNAWGLMTTTAGWVGESVLLETIYKRGLTGTRLAPDLDLTRADDLTMFWSHTPRQPWQTADYYAEQRRSLRPNTYLRLHENRWTTAESTFLTPDLWDPCVHPKHAPYRFTDRTLTVVAGVDASTKGDSSAVVIVSRAGDTVALVDHTIWQPTRDDPMDFEQTIEAFLREIHARFRVAAIYCDPYQLHRSIITLAAAGLPITEFPQTVSNTVRMGQTLFELLRAQRLVLYPDAPMRQQALNTVAIESPRGFRIAKEKASRKIDAIVALSLACVAALDAPVRPPFRVW